MTDKTTEEARNQELFDLIESMTGKVLVQSELDDIIRVVMKTAAIQSPAADEVAAAWKALDLWMFGDGKIPTPKQYMALKDAVTRSTLQTPAVNAEVLGKVREALETADVHVGWGDCTLENVHKMLREALRLLSTVHAPVQQWRDISTAPRDGTRIYVSYPRCLSSGTVEREVWWEDGVWRYGHTWGEFLGYETHKPTHWMPLPAAPVKGGE